MKKLIIFALSTLVLVGCTNQKPQQSTPRFDVVANIGRRIPPPQANSLEGVDVKINPEDTLVQYEALYYEHYTLALNGKQYVQNKTATPIEFVSITRTGEKIKTEIEGYSRLLISPMVLNFSLTNAKVNVLYEEKFILYKQEGEKVYFETGL